MTHAKRILVYSCSGSSNVAQLANDIAVSLDRQGLAEMSCIAGVGGDVRGLVKVAKSGREICAIDGCALACVKHSLKRHGVTPEWHIELTQLGLKKSKGESCSVGERTKAIRHVYETLGVVDPGCEEDLPARAGGEKGEKPERA